MHVLMYTMLIYSPRSTLSFHYVLKLNMDALTINSTSLHLPLLPFPPFQSAILLYSASYHSNSNLLLFTLLRFTFLRFTLLYFFSPFDSTNQAQSIQLPHPHCHNCRHRGGNRYRLPDNDSRSGFASLFTFNMLAIAQRQGLTIAVTIQLSPVARLLSPYQSHAFSEPTRAFLIDLLCNSSTPHPSYCNNMTT